MKKKFLQKEYSVSTELTKNKVWLKNNNMWENSADLATTNSSSIAKVLQTQQVGEVGATTDFEYYYQHCLLTSELLVVHVCTLHQFKQFSEREKRLMSERKSLPLVKERREKSCDECLETNFLFLFLSLSFFFFF